MLYVYVRLTCFSRGARPTRVAHRLFSPSNLEHYFTYIYSSHAAADSRRGRVPRVVLQLVQLEDADLHLRVIQQLLDNARRDGQVARVLWRFGLAGGSPRLGRVEVQGG